jgi:hypothetical protein
MKKQNEIILPDSCLNRADDDEMIFVLLARDPAAPVAIRAWIHSRITLGKNQPLDQQLIEAERCASMMELQYIIREAAKRRQEAEEDLVCGNPCEDNGDSGCVRMCVRKPEHEGRCACKNHYHE